MWTPERDQILKDMWAKGYSGTTIAKEIGGKSRNAVIGRAYRLGLGRHRPNVIAKRERKIASRKGTLTTAAKSPLTMKSVAKAGGREAWIEKKLAAKPIDLGPKPLPLPRPEIVGRVTFQDLEPGMCKFPVGNEAPFLFCAAPAVEGKPYCSDCCRVAYSAPVVRSPRATRVPTFTSFERALA